MQPHKGKFWSVTMDAPVENTGTNPLNKKPQELMHAT
jgi:hypothetical protein